jgi:hypothetical protein
MKRYGLTSEAVVDQWQLGRSAGTSAAKVPGGRRVEAIREKAGTSLYSYRTIVAVNNADGTVAVTPRRYSVTTSKLMGKVQRLLLARGYRPTERTQDVWTAVPGRWGGYGPAWAASSHEALPFVVWERGGE